MLTWIKIAALNLFRNTRRSIITSVAIALGYAAVNIFAGFAEYMFSGLRDAFIYVGANGHLTVVKKGFFTEYDSRPGRYLLSEGEVDKIRVICRQDARTVMTTPRLQAMGMLSNGDTSTIAVAVGYVPSDASAMQRSAPKFIAKLKLFDGRALDDAVPFGVALTAGLAKKLNLTLDSDATLVAQTLEGQMNALDVKVFALFETSDEIMNDKLMGVPLNFTQSLLDTKGAERVCVLLNERGQTQAARSDLLTAFAKNGLDIEIKTWDELSPLYERSKQLFDIIFLFLFVIMLVIVVMSVLNTVGTAVIERTQEIGALRALGVKRGGVVRMFAIESALLGCFGTFAGFVLTVVVSIGVQLAEFTWMPPAMAKRVPIEVHLVPGWLAISFIVFILLTVLAAVLPARRAARQNVVEALGHV